MTNLIVKSEVKRNTEFNISKAVYPKLEELFKAMVEKAEERAEGNGRKTLKVVDF